MKSRITDKSRTLEDLIETPAVQAILDEYQAKTDADELRVREEALDAHVVLQVTAMQAQEHEASLADRETELRSALDAVVEERTRASHAYVKARSQLTACYRALRLDFGEQTVIDAIARIECVTHLLRLEHRDLMQRSPMRRMPRGPEDTEPPIKMDQALLDRREAVAKRLAEVEALIPEMHALRFARR